MKYLYLIIIGILIALALWLYLRPQNEQKDIDVTQLTRTLEDKVKKAEQIKVSVIVKAREDSAKFEVINRSKDEEIARLKRRAVKAKTVHVDTVIAQDPEVGRYLHQLDSVVISQDAKIDTLNKQAVVHIQNFNDLAHASDSTAQANKELNDFVNKALEGENKRLRRQNRVLKVACVAVPLGIIALVVAK